jgi:tetratricopeptide (TPR) repeat protein
VNAEPRSVPLLVLLAGLHRARKTGLVHVLHGETQLVIELRHGDVAALEPPPVPPPPDTTDEGDSELASLLADAYLGGDPGLHRAAVRQTLLEALGWERTSCSFIEGSPAMGGDPPLGLSTEELLLEAAHALADPNAIRQSIGDLDRPLQACGDPASRVGVPLSPTEGYILSRVDGRMSAREVMQLVPLDPAETERSLFGLILAGIVDFGEAPPPPVPRPRPRPDATPTGPVATFPPPPVAPSLQAGAEPPRVFDAAAQAEIEARRREIYEAHSTLVMNRNHFEVLGVPRSATDAEIKAAYFRLARRFHPDSFNDPSLEDLQGRVQVVLTRLGEAYAVLGNSARRSHYESMLPKQFNPPRAARPPETWRAPLPGDRMRTARTPDPEPAGSDDGYTVSEEDAAFAADEALLRGEQLLGEEKYWDAIQVVEGSDVYMFGKRRQKSRLLLARAYMKNPGWRKKSEQLLQSVVRDEPDNADAYFLLGALYKEGGLENRAATMFKRALELRPGHKQALEALGAPAPLMKRLFGRV